MTNHTLRGYLVENRNGSFWIKTEEENIMDEDIVSARKRGNVIIDDNLNVYHELGDGSAKFIHGRRS